VSYGCKHAPVGLKCARCVAKDVPREEALRVADARLRMLFGDGASIGTPDTGPLKGPGRDWLPVWFWLHVALACVLIVGALVWGARVHGRAHPKPAGPPSVCYTVRASGGSYVYRMVDGEPDVAVGYVKSPREGFQLIRDEGLPRCP